MTTNKITAGAKKQTRAVWDLLAETYRQWSRDNAPTLGAALAFYTTFSLAPLLIVAMAVAGFIFGRAEVQAEIFQRLQELVGPEGARAVKIMLSAAFRHGSGLTASVIGVGVLLYGATRTFVMLRQALNLMWGVKPPPRLDLGEVITGQLLSFAMVLGIGFLLVLSLVASAGLAAASRFLQDLLPVPVFFFQLADVIFSIALITLLIATIFKVLPEVHIAWSDVWVGAALTALLFTVGNVILGWYLAKSAVSSAYGAASSLAVLLLWVYYSAQILFLGAEFTQVYANRYGSKVQPRASRRAPALPPQEPQT
jgi:membrane protein